MKKTIGILAHVDAGKTTVSEQILYHTKAIRTTGRVDHQTSFMDCHEIEKRRGITIFSDQACFEYQGDTYYLIDTPGHVDFSSEMERAIEIMDAAIVVVSAVEGVQGHTKTVIRRLKEDQKPIFFFLNKTDRIGASIERVVKELAKECNQVVWFANQGKKETPQDEKTPSKFSYEDSMTEELIEQIATLDEELLEEYLEHGYRKEVFHSYLNQLVAKGKVQIAMAGSALYDKGIREFVEVLHQFTKSLNGCEGGKESQGFAARVYKIKYDSLGNRYAYIKVTQGCLRVREDVTYSSRTSKEKITEKVNAIRLVNGAKFAPVNQVEQGDICAITGLSKIRPGDGIGTDTRLHSYETMPMLTVKVEKEDTINERQLYHDLKQLEDEDPMLGVSYSSELQEFHINIMGTVQLEVLDEVIQQRYGYRVSFGEPRILYKETILEPVMGYGHFEPLRHYAEVHVRIEPMERGTGIKFQTECSTDALTSNFQHLVEQHVYDKTHKGVLIGAPLTDVLITLVWGRAHIKHTEGGDFKEATYRGIRQGLMKANSILLEPFMELRLEAEVSVLGRMANDMQKYSALVTSQEVMDTTAIITALGPVGTLMNYGKEFVAYTKGNGSLTSQFAGYFPCHNTEEVMKEYGYDPERDVQNPVSSVFCAKGSGFEVKWQDVERFMHGL